MDIRLGYSFPESLAAYRTAKGKAASETPEASKSNASSQTLPAVTTSPANTSSDGTKLVSETQQELENGYRRTRTFEQSDGRTFTRVEDFSLTAQGAKRTVIQQNPSGNVTRYEEILDRQNSGNFRRTQRFQDESGDIATQITGDYQVTDPFILTGGNAPPSSLTASSSNALRGTQLDLQA